MHTLQDAHYVKDILNLGLIVGMEFDPRDNAIGQRAYDVFTKCFEDGLLVHVTGDIIALSQPLIVQDAHIDEMIDTLRLALAGVDQMEANGSNISSCWII